MRDYEDPELKILLVGNSRNLLARPGLGEQIDSFPVVLRFNNFVTAGYESFVGSKTDWWARNENDDIEPRGEKFGRIILRLRGDMDDIYQSEAATLWPAVQREFPGTPVEVIPRSVFAEVMQLCGFERGPLTGTLVVAHLLHRYARVHLCGFDHLTGGPDTLRHYYSDINTVGESTVWHEPHRETRYMNGLIALGRVVPI